MQRQVRIRAWYILQMAKDDSLHLMGGRRVWRGATGKSQAKSQMGRPCMS